MLQRITDKVSDGGRRWEEGGGGGVGIYCLALINRPCVAGAVLQTAFQDKLLAKASISKLS